MIHQASGFHLDAEAFLSDILDNLIPRSSIFDQRVSGSDDAIVNLRICRIPPVALDFLISIAAAAALGPCMIV
jgi:hypothetical protein